MHVAVNSQIGPLRCWPGGLCLSRSIGDMDVGEFIVPVPYVKQVKVITFFFLSLFYFISLDFHLYAILLNFSSLSICIF